MATRPWRWSAVLGDDVGSNPAHRALITVSHGPVGHQIAGQVAMAEYTKFFSWPRKSKVPDGTS